MGLPNTDWPMFGLAEDIRASLRGLAAEDGFAALATLIHAKGGSPRELGAQMLIGREMVSGYLSGGCVEADVARHAQEVLAAGASQRLIYGQGGPVDLRLPCGGRIEVFLERMELGGEAIRRLLLADRLRLPALWITNGDSQTCLLRGEHAPAGLEAPVAAACAGESCGQAGEWIFRRFDPVLRLAVIGSDPPAIALARFAEESGLQTTLVRPNGPAEPPPIALSGYDRGRPGEALARLALDEWTAVVSATHQADIDDEALDAALRTPAFYVGVLGSRRKIEERNLRLTARGLTAQQMARLHAPLGLPIGGKGPAAIALSAIAAVVGEANGRAKHRSWPSTPSRDRLRLDAVVLAAGAASRFGGDKLLAPLGQGVVLDGAIRAAFGLGGRVHLVIPPHDQALSEAAARTARQLGRLADLNLVHAHEHKEGLAGSLRAGVTASLEADGLLVFLGDMPNLSAASSRRIGEALEQGALVAAPSQGGQRGHPVGFLRPLFTHLLALEGDRGASRLLDQLGEALVLIESPEPGLFDDIDTPSDLARLSPANRMAG